MKAEYSLKYAHVLEPYIELVAWACSEMVSLFNQVPQIILSLFVKNVVKLGKRVVVFHL